jgi:hypothetical protein
LSAALFSAWQPWRCCGAGAALACSNDRAARRHCLTLAATEAGTATK